MYPYIFPEVPQRLNCVHSCQSVRPLLKALLVALSRMPTYKGALSGCSLSLPWRPEESWEHGSSGSSRSWRIPVSMKVFSSLTFSSLAIGLPNQFSTGGGKRMCDIPITSLLSILVLEKNQFFLSRFASSFFLGDYFTLPSENVLFLCKGSLNI